MKLYNIYKGLILESNISTIDSMIDGEISKSGNKFYRSARIWYENKDGSLSQRYVFIYGKGKTKAGNPAIRAFQASGESTSGKANGFWKIFLIDKIKRIEPTDLKWYKPVNKIKGGENIPPYVGPTKDSSFMNGLEKGVENKS
mgnify:FL=1|tara:strand:- start:2284 stop:2712 length:429 start_codon:yes stop_codon:yes gene_type:complete